VKAKDDSHAAALLNAVAVKIARQADLMRVTVSPSSERQPAPEFTLLAPRTIGLLHIETHGGNVDCVDLKGHVVAETGGGVVRVDRIGGDVKAVSGGGEIQLGNVNGTVKAVSDGGLIRLAAAGGDVWIESSGGEIFIGEARGPVHASTAGGNIHVMRASASVTAQTSGGVIEIQSASGRVDARTSGGKILIGSANGVYCESGAGGITLRGVSGPVRAMTMSGSIVAEMTAMALLDSTLSTGGGDITVLLPSNVAVTVKAHNETAGASARIFSDFPEIRVTAEDAAALAVAEGAINGGGPLLRVSTARGSIYLKRQK
jgi:DUF4097 and DUF4098 domain-containing protein YvlB